MESIGSQLRGGRFQEYKFSWSTLHRNFTTNNNPLIKSVTFKNILTEVSPGKTRISWAVTLTHILM